MNDDTQICIHLPVHTHAHSKLTIIAVDFMFNLYPNLYVET